MKVLVIGSGGREHAIVYKLKQSELVSKIYCAPGNAGIALDAECADIAITDLKGLLSFATHKKIDLTVVGPEAPLVNGIVDLFEENGMPIFGPSQKAAQLEGSKAYAKYFLERYDIPTAAFRIFDDFEQARIFVNRTSRALVVKADGLAAGKGAIVCEDKQQAIDALQLIMREKAFGPAGDKVVVEECLTGDEVSVLALADGENLIYLLSSQDHKRIFDNDQGPNTGGMGAYSPTPFVDDQMMQRIKKEIMQPTIEGMALEGTPYKGVLYAGLMITPEGPKVMEFNCRFGDPETQVILPLTSSDLLKAMLAVRNGHLGRFQWTNLNKAAVCVVIAAGGYPGDYQKNKPILGLDTITEEDIIVFHAGTRRLDNKIVTNGGRVLGVTALADTLEQAKDKAYRGVTKITFDGAYYRTDIAAKALMK